MPRAQNDYGFGSLRVEGGLLPPEYLQTIHALAAKHQVSTDYGLTRSLHLKDEIGRFWRMASDLWSDYQQRRERQDLDSSSVAIQTWLCPLLQSVLGYQDITACGAVMIGERRFPIGHQACGGVVPLVLIGHTFDLDRSDPRFGDEGRRRPPHGLLQEYLNASRDSLWGIVANGNQVRLVRDNPSLTRPAYIEADFERIFEEQLFADFAAFWLTFHVSRLLPRDGTPTTCILESWRTESIETGQRAREKLREGVTEALRHLGNGFLEHPQDEPLRQALSTGALTEQGYFQELLRLVYRLLFLFTVEDRELLFHPKAPEAERELYKEGYALSRLRERALKRRHYDQFGDLWQGLGVVFRGLSSGTVALGLPALGGLFASGQCPHLDTSAISNHRLLKAIRVLAFFESGKALARVNYRDMGTEELGSVYESLLELHPSVEVAPWSFGFPGENQVGGTRGSERKLSGSYYTPPELVNELIQSALVPVIEETLAQNPERPRDALLELKIVDPAAGSGHFLLAAARRLAAEIARLEAGLDTPDEGLRQHALREVVQYCIYGVDRNPLAVELCKAALWIETVESGKPLSFLDAHIRCGDSLVGILEPLIMEEGIPDEAYKNLTGDDPAVCRALKKRNQQSSRDGVQGNLFDRESLEGVTTALVDLEAMPEDTLEQIEAKRKAWEQAQAATQRQKELLKANLFVGAFFAPKTLQNVDKVPINEDLSRLAKGMKGRPDVADFAASLTEKHRFFHWHLAFPEVFAKGGFDVALGNPPWERIKLQEQEFFASRSPEIAKAPNKAARDRLIGALAQPDALPAEKALFRKFEEAKHEAEATSQLIRVGGRFSLTGVGDVNTYAVFAETFRDIVAPRGRSGFIVPTGIATDNSTKAFFEEVSTKGGLVSLYDFENRSAIFPGVHRSYKFSLLTLGRDITSASFVFFATQVEQLQDEERRFTLSPQDIQLINPNTKTCPVFRSNADAELTKKIYRRVPVLIDETKGAQGNPWGISFMAMFHMSTDSGLFRTFHQLAAEGAERVGMIWVDCSGTTWVPLYEAKMIHQYDHRWATYEENGKGSRELTEREKKQSSFEPLPRYWVPEREVAERLRNKGWKHRWLMGWRDICRSTDERTVIATAFSELGVSNKLPLVLPATQYEASLVVGLIANLSVLVFDFIARQKIGGTTLNFFYFKQLPVLLPDNYGQADLDFIVPRVLELAYTSEAMRPFAEDLGYRGSPFPWGPGRRAILRAELDAYYARLYGLTRDELRYILDPADIYGKDYPSETFRVLKNKEIRELGEYRTSCLVLDAWDRLEGATRRVVAA